MCPPSDYNPLAGMPFAAGTKLGRESDESVVLNWIGELKARIPAK
jgi:hypothetical protein